MFTLPPTIELLQQLTPSSLRQNLARAVRLWVHLRFLYGDESQTLGLPNPFTYPDWRDRFLSESHPRNDADPSGHDAQCHCAISMREWLFNNEFGMTEQDWVQALQQRRCCPDNLAELLNSSLFAVTRRSLLGDFKTLVDCRFLQQNGTQYQRVDRLFSAESVISSSSIIHADLAAIAENLTQQLNGYQRFFLHVDYVVPPDAVDQVDEWQARLKSIWEARVITPVELQYWSSRQQSKEKWIVYPVCVYYVQRATYLCAWGVKLTNPELLTWHNFRLHNIQDLHALGWHHKAVPTKLREAQQRGKLPTPDEIQERMTEAWGFDFYQPCQRMILRFERWFDEGYVRNTMRHETFQPITYLQAQKIIRQEATNPAQRKALLNVMAKRSPQDAYYQVNYRENDPNVLLRLRAWRPKLEVLLPWELRQQMIQEIHAESTLYE